MNTDLQQITAQLADEWNLANALRKVVSLLQYDNADWQEPNDHMIINVKDILELADELDNLK